MLWLLFGSRKAYQELSDLVVRLDARLSLMEADWKAQVAALENAAELYNRASARLERSKPRDGARSPAAPGSLEDVRRRRGGF